WLSFLGQVEGEDRPHYGPHASLSLVNEHREAAAQRDKNGEMCAAHATFDLADKVLAVDFHDDSPTVKPRAGGGIKEAKATQHRPVNNLRCEHAQRFQRALASEIFRIGWCHSLPPVSNMALSRAMPSACGVSASEGSVASPGLNAAPGSIVAQILPAAVGLV